MFLLVRPLLQTAGSTGYQAVGRLTPDILAIILVGVLVSSYLTSEIGIHAIFGAFFFGAIMPREGAHQLFHEILERLEQMTVLLLLPVFFVVTGPQRRRRRPRARRACGDLGASSCWSACAGKFIGAAVAGPQPGRPDRARPRPSASS